jgi:hypothetical protein
MVINYSQLPFFIFQKPSCATSTNNPASFFIAFCFGTSAFSSIPHFRHELDAHQLYFLPGVVVSSKFNQSVID